MHFSTMNKGLYAALVKLSSNCSSPLLTASMTALLSTNSVSAILLLEPQTDKNVMVQGQDYMAAEAALSSQTWSHKVICTVFWHGQGIILLDFVEPEATINSERYI